MKLETALGSVVAAAEEDASKLQETNTEQQGVGSTETSASEDLFIVSDSASDSFQEYVKMSSVHEKMGSINENSSYTNFEKLPLEGNAQNLKLWEEESIQKHAENDSLTVDSSSNITSISNLEESTPSNSNTEETTLDDVQIKYTNITIPWNVKLNCLWKNNDSEIEIEVLFISFCILVI